MSNKNSPAAHLASDTASSTSRPADVLAAVSRRGFLKLAGASGLAGATGSFAATGKAATTNPDGTPEQIHLTWGSDPTSEVVVSWASLATASNPRVQFGAAGEAQQTVHGVQRIYTDGINGATVFTYHARLRGLKPANTYQYTVTADNDSNAAQPFTASFQTAPRGRTPFRWTTYGDLATPNTQWVLSYPQSRLPCRPSNASSRCSICSTAISATRT